MELNHYAYMAITAMINTLIGYFILFKILKLLETNSKFSVSIYFFFLFSIIFFIMFLFMDIHKNRIIFEFPIITKKILFMFIDSMLFSLVICLFFSFMIFIIYIFEKK